MAPLVFVLAGALFATSAVSSGGTDLRPSRYDDLADLARARSDRAEALDEERAQLQAQIEQLTSDQTGVEIKKVTKRIEELRGPAGFEPVQGPGVVVTLTDAPAEVLDDGTGEINRKLVHQQDIQAVANALWAGGAEAVTVQGQRIVTTTGIRCVGNSVLLHGVAYAPPYVIAGIGDPTQLRARIDRDPSIALYLQDAETYQLGWDLELEDSLSFPGYDGPGELEYARPLGELDDDT